MYAFKKGKFSLQGSAIAPNHIPLCHWSYHDNTDESASKIPLVLPHFAFTRALDKDVYFSKKTKVDFLFYLTPCNENILNEKTYFV